jgi:GNAT superfamily N-acetyltransferase
MLTPVPAIEREPLRPLFEGFPGLHGIIDSVIEGVLGKAWADDISQPRVARLELDFQLIAGDPSAPSATDELRALPEGASLAIPDSWTDLLLDALDTVQPYDRFDFGQPERWDRTQLASMRESLPGGLAIERITADSVGAFAPLADSLVYNFQSQDDFLARGIGFGIREGDRFIAGCSSFAISSRSLEFEIQTHPDFQRRGLALATGSRMIEHCLDSGLTPYWDAAHEGSAVLAERLGFGERRPYSAYRIG